MKNLNEHDNNSIACIIWSVNNVPPEPKVNSTHSISSVNNVPPEPKVNSTHSIPSVNNVASEPKINSTLPMSNVDKTPVEPCVNSTRSISSVKNTLTDPNVNSTRSISSANNTPIKPITELSYMVLSLDSCGFCSKAKKLLDFYNINYTSINYNSDNPSHIKYSTVPQIWDYNGKHIGGFNELKTSLARMQRNSRKGVYPIYDPYMF